MRDRPTSPNAREALGAALELGGDARVAFLDELRREDRAVHAEVTELLAAAARAPACLDESAAAAFEVDDSDDGDLTGRTAGAYAIVNKLAAGGMGEVYLAEQPGHAPVVVKVLKRGMDSQEILDRFARERDTLARIDHPNIVSLCDAGSLDDGRPFLVMEHVEGRHLDRYCQEEALPIDERLQLMLEVCAAVQHAHANLVLHRDLKPSNIVVTHAGVPKLLDFGVAKLVDLEAEHTRTGHGAPLTPAYASPEQLRGQSATTASDVFALGVVLCELLTGHSPFASRARRDRRALRPSTLVHDAVLRRRLRGDLDAIVAMAWRPEPERRYASVAHFAEDLENYLEGRAVTARGKGRAYLLETTLRRHWRAAAAAVVVFAALVTALVVTQKSLQTAREMEQRAWSSRGDALSVTEFLVHLLDAGTRDDVVPDHSLVEALDAAETQLAPVLIDHPFAEARVRMAYGRANALLERWDKAERHLRRAIELIRGLPSFNRGSLVYCLEGLAAALVRGGHPGPEAEACAREARELRKRYGLEFPAPTWSVAR